MKNALLSLALVASLSACAGTRPDSNPVDGMPQGAGLFSGQSGNLATLFLAAKGADQASGGVLSNMFKSAGTQAVATAAGQAGTMIGQATELAQSPMFKAAVAALQVFPGLSANGETGQISTGWATNPLNSAQQIAANARVLGEDVSPQNLFLSLMTQQQDSEGEWQQAPAPRTMTNALLTQILGAAGTMMQAQ